MFAQAAHAPRADATPVSTSCVLAINYCILLVLIVPTESIKMSTAQNTYNRCEKRLLIVEDTYVRSIFIFTIIKNFDFFVCHHSSLSLGASHSASHFLFEISERRFRYWHHNLTPIASSQILQIRNTYPSQSYNY